MTSQQLTNNIVRGTSQTLALYLAGVRAVEISAFDEPIRTPSRQAHIVGLRTQQIVQVETGVTDVVDPLGGSYYVEALTDETERLIEERVRHIESQGDISDLHAQGFFRSIFVEAMVQRAQEVQDGTRRMVGANCHMLPPEEDTMLRDIASVRIEPYYGVIDEVVEWKSRRDMPTVLRALDRLESAGRDTTCNLMPDLVAALEADVTMGEAAGVLREAYGYPYDPLHGTARPQ
jgi:methylmalonyl-CoA mutase N-terminal domain/subunit